MKIRILLVFLIMSSIFNTTLANENDSLYDFSFEDIDGNLVNLEHSDSTSLRHAAAAASA